MLDNLKNQHRLTLTPVAPVCISAAICSVTAGVRRSTAVFLVSSHKLIDCYE